MDVGWVEFHDHDPSAGVPLIDIPAIINPAYRPEWPDIKSIHQITKKYLYFVYPQHMGWPQIPPLIDIVHPHVKEPGGVIHQMPTPNEWVEPIHDNFSAPICVTAPKPVTTRSTGQSWVEFLEHQQAVNQGLEERETPIQKQRRETLTKDALKINKNPFSGPSKKSTVYVWVEEGETEGLLMKDRAIPGWKRV